LPQTAQVQKSRLLSKRKSKRTSKALSSSNATG